MGGSPLSRLRKAKRLLSDALTGEGRQSLVARLAQRLATRVPPSLSQHHVLKADILGARPPATRASQRSPDSVLRVGWIVTPPAAGSGGHTTAFRMVGEMERAGHSCELLLYDTFGGSTAEQESVIRRNWPHLRATVRSINDGLNGLDACVATGWQTAYALATRSRNLDLHRFYFIQDYEPFFYPRGYEYELAEATYGLDMHLIALDDMISNHLRTLGVDCLTVPFGCDTDTYRLMEPRTREGVVYFSRAGTARRGFLLAAMALEEFHRRRPDVPIKVFGPLERTSFNFPVSWMGLQTPQQLNELYNSSIAGLGMSFTNISLVPGEMLAAGCIPVVNDSPDGRLVLRSPHVRWAAPNPIAVAEALVAVVDDPPTDLAEVSSSTHASWSVTQAEFVSAVTGIVTSR